MLNTTTNIKLYLEANTANNSTVTITGAAVAQKFKVGRKQLSYGSTTMSSGYITKSYTTAISPDADGSIELDNTPKEMHKWTISSIVPYEKLVTIATLTIAPDSGYRLANMPSISVYAGDTRGSTLLLKRKTNRSWDIMCNIKEKTTDLSKIEATLNYNIFRSPTKTTNTITKLYTSSRPVGGAGEKREIKIYGAPNTPFDLSVLDSDNNSILTSPNSKIVLPIGETSSHSGKLSKRGYYSYFQKFPPPKTIRSTAVNGSMAVSGATKVIFDNLTDVQVGDEIHLLNKDTNKPFSTTPIKVITLNPDTDNANECTLSESITAPDNKKVKFKRPQDFKVNIETSGTKGSNIPIGFPTYTVSQYSDPMLKLIAVCTGATRINGAIAGVSDITYKGLTLGKESLISVTYVLTGKTFNLTANKPEENDFTVTQGQVNFSIRNLTVTGNGTTTLTIKAEMYINLSSRKSVDPIIKFNTDNIIT